MNIEEIRDEIIDDIIENATDDQLLDDLTDMRNDVLRAAEEFLGECTDEKLENIYLNMMRHTIDYYYEDEPEDNKDEDENDD